jgi:UDP:flavonoid glycosyltransferase YjiC (YdhE family)
LKSIPSTTFLQRLAAGQPLYSEADLEDYIADDLQLIESFEPDIVVGDFRLSLAVSAPTAGVPYVAICNAHWSPYVTQQSVPVPEIPLTRVLGPKIGQYLFDLARPIAFAQHARPMNRLRRRFGLPPLNGLRHVYTEADLALYADPPSLIQTSGLPPHHRFIGPILWEPKAPEPEWWNAPVTDQPLVYVTLGSSGQTRLLPMLREVLGKLPVQAMIATAGRIDLPSSSNGIWYADFLPGTAAAQRAALVICSGGSATAYQALATGTPVLGLASNLDQFLTMSYVEKSGAGRLLRADTAQPAGLAQAINALLKNGSFTSNAERQAQSIREMDAQRAFRAHLTELTGNSGV